MKYWVAVASQNHVKNGIEQNIIQVCHGKEGPLRLMKEGDWIVYYSPVLRFGEKKPCRSFTGIAQIVKGEPYLFQMSDDFVPWRRDVLFYSASDVSILPLIEHLSFIKNKKNWGFPFRRGCFAISFNDFLIIAKKMGILVDDTSKRFKSMAPL